MNIRRSAPPRAAFTLVELMVAMALIIFIMYILAEAFAAGTSAFRNLKGVGDMNLRLRTASNVLRRYLGAYHFKDKQLLSDSTVWTQNGNGPPPQGFFRIIQSAGATNEGTDLDGIPSSRTTQTALHFTVNLGNPIAPGAPGNGNDPSDFFRTGVPGGSSLLSFPFPDSRYQDPGSTVYNSQWAEVAIYLRDSGTTTENPAATANGLSPQNLFTMYMRQRLLLPGNFQNLSVNPKVNYSAFKSYLEVSATQDPANAANLYFNTSADVTMPARRFGVVFAMTNSDPANIIPASAVAIQSPPVPKSVYPTLGEEDGTQGGNDILLQDVLSCSIKVLLSKAAYNGAPPTFVDLLDPIVTQYATGNNSSIPAGTSVFDTWSQASDGTFDYSGTKWVIPGTPTSIPMFLRAGDLNPISIQAIQISIRVWDVRTQQTRQSSIVVPL